MVSSAVALLLTAPVAFSQAVDPVCGLPCKVDDQCTQAATNCTWCIDSVCSVEPQDCRGGPPEAAKTSLPQYFVIGDSVSHGYSTAEGGLVKSLLERNLFEVFPVSAGGGGEAGATDRGSTCLPTWIGANKSRFDVVSYNWGLHDIEQTDVGIRVSLSDYRSNLVRIARLLRRRLPMAKQLFITTTPVSSTSLQQAPPRSEADVILYNKNAKLVLANEGVPVLDLWAWMDASCGGDPYAECPPGCAEMEGGEKQNCLQLKDNVHFYEQGYRHAVQAISAAVTVLHYGSPCPDFLRNISTGLCDEHEMAVIA